MPAPDRSAAFTVEHTAQHAEHHAYHHYGDDHRHEVEYWSNQGFRIHLRYTFLTGPTPASISSTLCLIDDMEALMRPDDH